MQAVAWVVLVASLLYLGYLALQQYLIAVDERALRKHTNASHRLLS
jgi:hypothetical protein